MFAELDLFFVLGSGLYVIGGLSALRGIVLNEVADEDTCIDRHHRCVPNRLRTADCIAFRDTAFIPLRRSKPLSSFT